MPHFMLTTKHTKRRMELPMEEEILSGRAQDWLDQAEWDLKHAENDVRGEYYAWHASPHSKRREKRSKLCTKREIRLLGDIQYGNYWRDYVN